MNMQKYKLKKHPLLNDLMQNWLKILTQNAYRH